MQAYYINLARRTDRRARMEAQLQALKLSSERIDAILIGDVPQPMRDRYLPGGRHARLSAPEFCCGISHIAACQRLLDSTDRYTLILEDDIVLSPRLPAFLTAFALDPMDIDLLRLETFASPAQISVRPRERLGVYGLHSMHGWAWGAAAYIVSRRFAETVVRDGRALQEVIDRVLYRPYGAGHAKRRQLVPALAIQQDRMPGQSWGQDSDLTPVRDSAQRQARSLSPLRRIGEFVDAELLTALPSALHRLTGRSHKRDIPFSPD